MGHEELMLEFSAVRITECDLESYPVDQVLSDSWALPWDTSGPALTRLDDPCRPITFLRLLNVRMKTTVKVILGPNNRSDFTMDSASKLQTGLARAQKLADYGAQFCWSFVLLLYSLMHGNADFLEYVLSFVLVNLGIYCLKKCDICAWERFSSINILAGANITVTFSS
ncbi:hypothetical protein Ancab_031002 [Ancistrocladus abbreviatus]